MCFECLGLEGPSEEDIAAAKAATKVPGTAEVPKARIERRENADGL